MTTTKTGGAAQGTTAPAQTAPAPKGKVISLENMSMDITPLIAQDFDILNKSNPVKLDLSKEIEFAKQIIGKSDKLMRCLTENPVSVIDSIKNCVTAGLSLNPTLAEAYLIPRARNLGNSQWLQECHFEPGYRGFLKIIILFEAVKTAKAEVVYKEDLPTFDIQLGLDGYVIHKPYVQGKRTEIIGAYSEARLQDGSKSVEWMSIDDINDIMGRNETVKKNVGKRPEDQSKSTWHTDKPEMSRKAVMKRHAKYLLPHMKDPTRLSYLIEQDNKLNGIDFDKERQEKMAELKGATKQIEQQATKKAVTPPTQEEIDELQKLSEHPLLGGYKFGGLEAPAVFSSAKARFEAGEAQQSGVINAINKFKEIIAKEEALAIEREQQENQKDPTQPEENNEPE